MVVEPKYLAEEVIVHPNHQSDKVIGSLVIEVPPCNFVFQDYHHLQRDAISKAPYQIKNQGRFCSLVIPLIFPNVP